MTHAYERYHRERKAERYVETIDRVFDSVFAGLADHLRAELLLKAMRSWQPGCWNWLRRQMPGERKVPSRETIAEIRRVYERRAETRSGPGPIVLPPLNDLRGPVDLELEVLAETAVWS